MPNKFPDLQVVLPYKTLLELLEASQAVDSLRKDNERLSVQMAALRSQFTELMTLVGDLRKEIEYS